MLLSSLTGKKKSHVRSTAIVIGTATTAQKAAPAVMETFVARIEEDDGSEVRK